MSDDNEGARRAYYDSAYGDLGTEGTEDTEGTEESVEEAAAVTAAAVGADDADGVDPTDAGTADPVVSARGDRSEPASTLDRVAETLATLGVYVALVSTLAVPIGLAAVGMGVQPAGNYLVTGSLGGWVLAMGVALVAGMRESDPYENAEEKRETERSFF
ncbi:hypothetical protein JCM17823_07260 [Halorubrum gandharaense]